jgi:hypothetical protein
MMVVGIQAHMQACMGLVGTRVRIQVCMLVGMEDKLVGMVGKQVHKPEHTQDGIVLDMVEGMVCMVVDNIQAGKVVHTLAGMIDHTLAGKVDRNIQMSYSSHDCRSIPSIGVPSCTEEATRHLFLVVFSL